MFARFHIRLAIVLLATLEKLGIAGNTPVIFTSDNGPETTSVIHMRADHGHDGARPWRGVKRDQWDGGHHVPFLVRWPGHGARRQCNGHHGGKAEVYMDVGEAMGKAMVDLLQNKP